MSVEPEDISGVEDEGAQAGRFDARGQAAGGDLSFEAGSEDAESVGIGVGWKKEIPVWARITIIASAAAIILFAFIWEMFYVGGADEYVEEAQASASNTVQDKLNRLDWVIPDFLPVNEYSRPGTSVSKVNAIVIHYIGNPGTSAEQNRNYFANLEFTGEAHASSNFIVGLDGEIIQCVPVDEVAYASAGRNADTLSIELCHPDDTGQFTDETYASAVRLTAWLCKQYRLGSGDLLRHFDVTGKECPRYFVHNEDAWEAFKADVASELEQPQDHGS